MNRRLRVWLVEGKISGHSEADETEVAKMALTRPRGYRKQDNRIPPAALNRLRAGSGKNPQAQKADKSYWKRVAARWRGER